MSGWMGGSGGGEGRKRRRGSSSTHRGEVETLVVGLRPLRG